MFAVHWFVLWLFCVHNFLTINDSNQVTGPGALKSAFITFMNMQNAFEQNITHPYLNFNRVTQGIHKGLGNSTLRAVGKKVNAGEWVARGVMPRKNRFYEAVGMNHFSKETERLVPGAESCVQRIHREVETPNLVDFKPYMW